MIELNNVTVIYNKGTADERVALKDVSLNVEDGEFLIVVGPNGAGKSTLLKVLTGEVRPFRAAVRCMARCLSLSGSFRSQVSYRKTRIRGYFRI